MSNTEKELLVVVRKPQNERKVAKISGLMRTLLVLLGILSWDDPKTSADEQGRGGREDDVIVAVSPRKRKSLVFCALALIALMNAWSAFASVLYFYCYYGRMDHFLRFVSFLCYWPCLISAQVICLYVAMKRRFRISDDYDISWINIFDESSCVRKLSRLRYPKFVGLPKIGVLACVFLPFPVVISLTRVIFFYKMEPSCRYWLQYIYVLVECVNVFYFAYFCFFLYLRRVVLEETCTVTAAFVKAHVREMDRCLDKTRAFFKDYIQLRKLLLPWLTFVLFNATFGVTVIATWSYHLNVFPNNLTMTNLTTAHARVYNIPVCYYSCDKVVFLQERYVMFLYNLLVSLRHIMVAVLSYTVVRGIDLKYIWERFRMRINFMLTTKDNDFWREYKKFVDQLHPSTTVDTLFSFFVPLIGFASGILGGRQNNF